MEKKKKILWLGVLVMALVFGMTVIGCGGSEDGNQTSSDNKDPVASDYTFGNMSQTAGNVTKVTITVKSGKSSGAISNIRYASNSTIPQTAGTYAVTFDVAAVAGWNAAIGLSAGNLVVSTGNKTPVASDYEFGNMRQISGNVIAVTIAAKSGKSPGAISNIRYSGNTTVPQTAGSYTVYFDVAAATGWDAVADLSPGNLTVDYKVGDTGPGGGKIFYYSAAGFTMTDNNQICHYLEVAPINQGTLAWASSGFTLTNIPGTENAIGTGRKNTALILAIDANAPAARACDNYTGGGKNDWFLPSDGELLELYRERTVVGISLTSFWSSSQGNSYGAYTRDFYDGKRYNDEKEGYDNVRAIRAF